jgi:hypothetical protein
MQQLIIVLFGSLTIYSFDHTLLIFLIKGIIEKVSRMYNTVGYRLCVIRRCSKTIHLHFIASQVEKANIEAT